MLRTIFLFALIGLRHAHEEAVVFVVDPGWDCVESYVANVPLLQKYKIVKVMTNPGESTFCNYDHADIYRTIAYNSFTPNDTLAAEEICPKLQGMGLPVAAVIPTFDPAVYLADLLAACLGTRANPSSGPLAKARRDKWTMSEAVRRAGLRSIKEKLVTNWGEAKEYLESLDPPVSDANPIIFKILQGSSSEGVSKIHSMEEAEATFNKDFGTKSSFGDTIGELLIQEFLKGREYVIDSVSRDGVHKISMVFNEDLRPGNGIFNLYYGFKTMDPEDQKTKVIIDYANKVLDATGLRNGASDMEVMWVDGESTPCVIDLNARWTALMWHDGLALESGLTGSDQVTATINAYLDGDAFSRMPAVPSVKQHGAIVFASAHQAGILKAIPGLAAVKNLPSYLGSVQNPARAVVGHMLEINTVGPAPVTVLLADKNKTVLDADYNSVVRLVDSGSFFDVTPAAGNTVLTALWPGSGRLPSHRLPAFAAVAALAVAAMSALFAASRRNVGDATDYLSIE